MGVDSLVIDFDSEVEPLVTHNAVQVGMDLKSVGINVARAENLLNQFGRPHSLTNDLRIFFQWALCSSCAAATKYRCI